MGVDTFSAWPRALRAWLCQSVVAHSSSRPSRPCSPADNASRRLGHCLALALLSPIHRTYRGPDHGPSRRLTHAYPDKSTTPPSRALLVSLDPPVEFCGERCTLRSNAIVSHTLVPGSLHGSTTRIWSPLVGWSRRWRWRSGAGCVELADRHLKIDTAGCEHGFEGARDRGRDARGCRLHRRPRRAAPRRDVDVFDGLRASSTFGTFLRSLTFGHVRPARRGGRPVRGAALRSPRCCPVLTRSRRVRRHRQHHPGHVRLPEGGTGVRVLRGE